MGSEWHEDLAVLAMCRSVCSGVLATRRPGASSTPAVRAKREVCGDSFRTPVLNTLVSASERTDAHRGAVSENLPFRPPDRAFRPLLVGPRPSLFPSVWRAIGVSDVVYNSCSVACRGSGNAPNPGCSSIPVRFQGWGITV